MKRIVIIGAGAHGREVAQILRCQVQHGAAVQPLGFVDADQRIHNQVIDDLPVLGDWHWFTDVDRNEIFVICASGFPAIRKKMAERATLMGLSFANAIFPLSHISAYASIGEGIVIYQNATICRGSSIGNHALVNVGGVISHDTELGDYATLNPSVSLAGNVSIGEGCYLGIGCNVTQRIKIGPWTTVGAGAAVVRDLPANVTAVGVPARVIRTNSND
jgi:sugar O-acyltransferase (sialic acid O-acetyltransferase NeuD family)